MTAQVTLKISGLIILRFKEKDKICQAGILTAAPTEPKHKLRIRITDNTLPGTSDTVEFELADLYRYAPLHVYVTPNYGVPPIADNAIKGLGYDTVVDFVNLLEGQPLDLNPGVLAPLLIHHGTFHVLESDQEKNATIAKIDDPDHKKKTDKPVAKIISVDINLDKDITSGQIVLVGENYKRSFAIDVSRNATYLVEIQNSPTPSDFPVSSGSITNHFDMFYNAIHVDDGKPKYTISLPSPKSDEQHLAEDLVAKDSPPCISTQISIDGDLAEFP